MRYLIAFVTVLSLFTAIGHVDAHGGLALRQRVVVRQRIVQPVVRQKVVVQKVVQQQVMAYPVVQKVVQPVYVQPIYAQPIIQRQVQPCYGGLQLQQQGCAALY